jgi:hypothetical protein
MIEVGGKLWEQLYKTNAPVIGCSSSHAGVGSAYRRQLGHVISGNHAHVCLPNLHAQAAARAADHDQLAVRQT